MCYLYSSRYYTLYMRYKKMRALAGPLECCPVSITKAGVKIVFTY